MKGPWDLGCGPHPTPSPRHKRAFGRGPAAKQRSRDPVIAGPATSDATSDHDHQSRPTPPTGKQPKRQSESRGLDPTPDRAKASDRPSLQFGHIVGATTKLARASGTNVDSIRWKVFRTNRCATMGVDPGSVSERSGPPLRTPWRTIGQRGPGVGFVRLANGPDTTVCIRSSAG